MKERLSTSFTHTLFTGSLLAALLLMTPGCAKHSGVTPLARINTQPPGMKTVTTEQPVSSPSPEPSPVQPPPEKDAASDQELIQPVVNAVMNLSSQVHDSGPLPDGTEDNIRNALLSMLKKGRDLGMHFSGFSIGKFKGGSLGLSGQFGRELVIAIDRQNPGQWKVAAYSVTSYGVGIAAQITAGVSVSVLFDMEDISEYKNSFCSVAGLLGNVVDFGVSIRFSCGFKDFAKTAESLGSQKPDPQDSQGHAIEIPQNALSPAEQKALILRIAGRTRVKTIGGSLALGGGLPLGIVISYQPHKEIMAPAPFDVTHLDELITDTLF